MKKYFFVLILFFASYRAETPVEKYFKKSVVKKMDAKVVPPQNILVLAPKPTQKITLRSPAQTNNTRVESSPRRLNHLVVRNTSVKSPTGEWIVSNITALPIASYDPSLGREIFRDSNYAYFEGKTDDSLNAAFDPVNQRFYPISEVLLLRKIDQDLRREIVDEGHKEYYYNQRLEILSIQSNSQQVLPLYAEFKKRGLDVRIEVLKETAQPR